MTYGILTHPNNISYGLWEVKGLTITNTSVVCKLGFLRSKRPTFKNKSLFKSKKEKRSEKRNQPWICEEQLKNGWRTRWSEFLSVVEHGGGRGGKDFFWFLSKNPLVFSENFSKLKWGNEGSWGAIYRKRMSKRKQLFNFRINGEISEDTNW